MFFMIRNRSVGSNERTDVLLGGINLIFDGDAIVYISKETLMSAF